MGTNYNHTRGRDGKYCNTNHFRGRTHINNSSSEKKNGHALLLYGGDLPIKREKLQEESWKTSPIGRLIVRICNKYNFTITTGDSQNRSEQVRELEGELSQNA